jgi:tyrosyl-tRNA synthetase
MKKAFCEPGNTDFCPPITISSVFCFGPSSEGFLLVKRGEANGGDHKYESVADLEKDFSAGSLHPGDLKEAITLVMVNVLDKVSKGIKENKDATKAVKDLKAFQKKMSKMKK